LKRFHQLPNAITLSRLALAPVLILLLKDENYPAALAVFVVAGISDGLDGFIAKRFDLRSRLGALLDPIADKVLVVCSYVMLSMLAQIPFWLVVAVVFRDLLIVGGYLTYTSVIGPVSMRPTPLSKLNTTLQVVLVGAVLLQQAYAIPGSQPFVDGLVWIVLATTILSGAQYVWAYGFARDVDGNGNGARGGRTP